MVQSEGLPYVNCHEFRFFVSFLLTVFSIFITIKRLQMKKLATSLLFLFVSTLAVKAVGSVITIFSLMVAMVALSGPTAFTAKVLTNEKIVSPLIGNVRYSEIVVWPWVDVGIYI